MGACRPHNLCLFGRSGDRCSAAPLRWPAQAHNRANNRRCLRAARWNLIAARQDFAGAGEPAPRKHYGAKKAAACRRYRAKRHCRPSKRLWKTAAGLMASAAETARARVGYAKMRLQRRAIIQEGGAVGCVNHRAALDDDRVIRDA